MNRNRPLDDMTIHPEGGPTTEDFIRHLRGTNYEHDRTMIQWLENGEEDRLKKHIRETLIALNLSAKSTETIFDQLSRRLCSQSPEEYSSEIMAKIMSGFSKSIEEVIEGVQNR